MKPQIFSTFTVMQFDRMPSDAFIHLYFTSTLFFSFLMKVNIYLSQDKKMFVRKLRGLWGSFGV